MCCSVFQDMNTLLLLIYFGVYLLTRILVIDSFKNIALSDDPNVGHLSTLLASNPHAKSFVETPPLGTSVVGTEPKPSDFDYEEGEKKERPRLPKPKANREQHLSPLRMTVGNEENDRIKNAQTDDTLINMNTGPSDNGEINDQDDNHSILLQQNRRPNLNKPNSGRDQGRNRGPATTTFTPLSQRNTKKPFIQMKQQRPPVKTFAANSTKQTPEGQKEEDNCGVEGYVKAVNGICYKIHKQHLNRDEASEACKEESASLASIHSGTENWIILAMIRKANLNSFVWIGVTCANNAECTWDDGTPFSYKRYVGFVSGTSLDCFVLSARDGYHGNGNWYAHVCEGRRPFICKFTSNFDPPIIETCTNENYTRALNGKCYRFVWDSDAPNFESKSYCIAINKYTGFGIPFACSTNYWPFVCQHRQEELHDTLISLTNEPAHPKPCPDTNYYGAGIISSPAFPQYYGSTYSCTYNIQAEIWKRVKLNLFDFKLDECCDALLIYDVRPQGNRLMLRQTGSFQKNITLASTGQYLSILYYTTKAKKDKKFVAEFESVSNL
uniref:C-type LECtin n=1 Tax=Rhabditophanes sp. KR3021 TaxID=114890 RepID=A0AC35TNB6_9BILA